MRCAYGRREVACRPTALGGPPCLGQIPVHSNEEACFPEQGTASPRARPPGGCDGKDPDLKAFTASPPPPPRPRGPAADNPDQQGIPRPRTGRGGEHHRAGGRCGRARRRKPGRGGGKVYTAPDWTVLFVPSATDFDTGHSAILGGAHTPSRGFTTTPRSTSAHPTAGLTARGREIPERRRAR